MQTYQQPQPQRRKDEEFKVALRGPREVLGGLLLVVAAWVIGPKTWLKVVSELRRKP
jgi:hypothetical protein